MTITDDEVDLAIFPDGSEGLSTDRFNLRLPLAEFVRVVELAPEHQISRPETWQKQGPAVLCRRRRSANSVTEYYARPLSDGQMAHLLGLASAMTVRPNRQYPL